MPLGTQAEPAPAPTTGPTKPASGCGSRGFPCPVRPGRGFVCVCGGGVVGRAGRPPPQGPSPSGPCGILEGTSPGESGAGLEASWVWGPLSVPASPEAPAGTSLSGPTGHLSREKDTQGLPRLGCELQGAVLWPESVPLVWGLRTHRTPGPWSTHHLSLQLSLCPRGQLWTEGPALGPLCCLRPRLFGQAVGGGLQGRERGVGRAKQVPAAPPGIQSNPMAAQLARRGLWRKEARGPAGQCGDPQPICFTPEVGAQMLTALAGRVDGCRGGWLRGARRGRGQWAPRDHISPASLSPGGNGWERMLRRPVALPRGAVASSGSVGVTE